jgi:hypothetical protein
MINVMAPVLLNINQRSDATGGVQSLPEERLKSGRFPVGLVSCRDNFYLAMTLFGQKIPGKI